MPCTGRSSQRRSVCRSRAGEGSRRPAQRYADRALDRLIFLLEPGERSILASDPNAGRWNLGDHERSGAMEL